MVPRTASRIGPTRCQNLHRDRELPVPFEQRENRDAYERVVYQHGVEEGSQVRPDGPFAHTGVPEKEHGTGLEAIIHAAHIRN